MHREAPPGLSHKLPFPIRMTFCKMSNVPRENRVFADGRAGGGKYAILAHRRRNNLSAEKRFFSDKCAWEKHFVYKGRKSRSFISTFSFLFAFPQEGLPPLQIEKHAEKSTPESRFPDKNSSERGLESGDMRTTVPRLAEKKSVYCGKRRALLRKRNGLFAEN